jgi:hypothetical protein
LTPVEVAASTATPENALVQHLFEIFAEPPRPQSSPDEPTGTPAIRRSHTVLHRAAVRKIVSTARQAGLGRDDVEVEPSITGSTRLWHFDLRIRRARRYLQHVLVLPEIEETFHEAAAVARIWQDVQARHARADVSLTAVFYSRNGMPEKAELEPGEKLLKKDRINTVYAKELPRYYAELVGQSHLWSHRD